MPCHPPTLPKNWPQGVTYLTKPSYSKAVLPLLDSLIPPILGSSDTAAAALFTLSNIPPSSEADSKVKITHISDASHPANGQSGLFATRHLSPGSFILFYLGYVHGPDADMDETSNYDLSLVRELGIGVDATHMGNEARFINDYRGVQDKTGPNAEFRDCWVEVSSKGKYERRIGVYVLNAGKSGKKSKGISKGEEILVSYGKGFWAHRNMDS